MSKRYCQDCFDHVLCAWHKGTNRARLRGCPNLCWMYRAANITICPHDLRSHRFVLSVIKRQKNCCFVGTLWSLRTQENLVHQTSLLSGSRMGNIVKSTINDYSELRRRIVSCRYCGSTILVSHAPCFARFKQEGIVRSPAPTARNGMWQITRRKRTGTIFVDLKVPFHGYVQVTLFSVFSAGPLFPCFLGLYFWIVHITTIDIL